jgi:predicted dehydrogenase
MQLFAPGSVSEKGWLVHRPAPGELQATLSAQHVSFSLLISLNSRPTTTALRLSGTKGTIHIDLFHGFCVIEPGAVSKLRKITHPFDLAVRTLAAAGGNLALRAWQREPAYPGLRQLIRDFYSAIMNGQPSPIRSEEVRQEEKVRSLLVGMNSS